jgi:hypothetical protein
MRTHTKIWLGIGTFALAASADPDGVEPGKGQVRAWGPIPAALADTPQQGGEEGEGGEGGERGATAQAESDEALAANLLLMRGHLRVGQELIEAGRTEDAAAHFAHPLSEVWELVEKPIAERSGEDLERGFEGDLEALLAAAKEGKTGGAYEERLAAVQRRIDTALALVGEEKRGRPAFVGDVLVRVLGTAAEEYGEAVADGRFVNAEEYQDAMGFVLAAEDYLAGHKDALAEADRDRSEAVRRHIQELKRAFPRPIPPEAPTLAPGEVRSLVSQVELGLSGFGGPGGSSGGEGGEGGEEGEGGERGQDG